MSVAMDRLIGLLIICYFFVMTYSATVNKETQVADNNDDLYNVYAQDQQAVEQNAHLDFETQSAEQNNENQGIPQARNLQKFYVISNQSNSQFITMAPQVKIAPVRENVNEDIKQSQQNNVQQYVYLHLPPDDSNQRQAGQQFRQHQLFDPEDNYNPSLDAELQNLLNPNQNFKFVPYGYNNRENELQQQIKYNLEQQHASNLNQQHENYIQVEQLSNIYQHNIQQQQGHNLEQHHTEQHQQNNLEHYLEQQHLHNLQQQHDLIPNIIHHLEQQQVHNLEQPHNYVAQQHNIHEIQQQQQEQQDHNFEQQVLNLQQQQQQQETIAKPQEEEDNPFLRIRLLPYFHNNNNNENGNTYQNQRILQQYAPNHNTEHTLQSTEDSLEKARLSKLVAQAEAEAIAKSPPEIVNQEISIVRRRPINILKMVHVPVPSPVLVPYPQPYIRYVPQPYAVPMQVIRPVYVPVEKTEHVEIEKPVPVEVEKIVHVPIEKKEYYKVAKPYIVEKTVPVEITKEIPVEIPIYKPQKLTIVRHIWEH